MTVHGDVCLDQLWRHLKRTPSGPLPDQLVPDAMWVRALMRWRKVKLLVRAWEIVLFWQSEARKRHLLANRFQELATL